MNRKMVDSGIRWIGKIPIRTQICRLKFLSYIKGRIGWQGLKSEDFITEGPYCVTGTDFVNGKINWETCYHVSHERYEMDSNIHLKIGDLLVTKDGTIGKLAKVTELPDKACLNSHLLIIRPVGGVFTNEYLYYVLSSPVFTGYFRHSSTGSTMESLSQKNMGEFAFPLYDIDTQHAIVRYLDSKCAAIDEAIERHKKIIEKLEEYRTCKISHITVNGLNPDAATKDSGIEWAGQIPATWKVSPLKSLFTFGKGLSITKADLVEKGVPVLSYGQIHSKRNLKTEISEDLIRFVPLDMAVRHTDSLAAINGFIFADTSEDMAGCGNCNYVNRPGVYGGYHTVVLKPNTSDDNKYLAYLFQTDAWRYQIRKELTEVKVFSVSQKVLKSTQVLLPPQQEQRAIVSYLDALCENISSRISMHANIIEKLEEYRKSVIYHAVTGKIDCREE